jgi:hypothetical protein
MSEHETVADIIREKREMAAEIRAHLSIVPARREDQLLEADSLDREADRIEAAAKREQLSRRAIKVPIEVVPMGNAAAVREALLTLRDAARMFCHQILDLKDNGKMDDYNALLDLHAAIPKANFALSAPPRNCDVGTPEEQAQRFHDLCIGNSSGISGMCEPSCPCKDCFDRCQCLCKWAQMPYKAEEGGAK